jgi:hypothetical protein
VFYAARSYIPTAHARRRWTRHTATRCNLWRRLPGLRPRHFRSRHRRSRWSRSTGSRIVFGRGADAALIHAALLYAAPVHAMIIESTSARWTWHRSWRNRTALRHPHVAVRSSSAIWHVVHRTLYAAAVAHLGVTDLRSVNIPASIRCRGLPLKSSPIRGCSSMADHGS